MPGVGAEQAALADRDDLLAAAGEGAHDRGAAADVGAVADHDARRDPALDHRGAERAGVVVHEALVHHRRALGQVRAQAHPVGVGDPDAGRQHVVDHPRELVDAVDGHVLAGAAQPGPGGLEALDRARAGRGPHHVGEQPEDAVHRDRLRRDEPAREQVQPQPGVLGGGRGGLQVRRLDQAHLAGDPAYVVGALERRELLRRRRVGRLRAQRGRGEPHVQDGAVRVEGGEAEAPGLSRCSSHGGTA